VLGNCQGVGATRRPPRVGSIPAQALACSGLELLAERHGAGMSVIDELEGAEAFGRDGEDVGKLEALGPERGLFVHGGTSWH
jgi:hypothetical protein